MNPIVRRRPWWFAEEDVAPFIELERVARRWMGRPRGPRRRWRIQGWAPAVDMVDKGDRLVLYIELPGVSKDAIDITLQDGILTVQGERKAVEDVKDDEWLCCERLSGKFYRAIRLPAEVDGDKAKAEYRDGVLTITLPKLPEAQPHKVTITAK